MYKIDLNKVSKMIMVNNNNPDNVSVVILDKFTLDDNHFGMRTFTHLPTQDKKPSKSCLCKRCAKPIDNSDLIDKYFVYNVEQGYAEYQSTVSEKDLHEYGNSVLVQDVIGKCTISDGIVAYKAMEMELCPECAMSELDTYGIVYEINEVMDIISSCSDNGYAMIFIIPEDNVEVIIISDNEIYIKHLD